ncbi:hypothetical protein Tco_1027662, partial [Tanacetum coccineum]
MWRLRIEQYFQIQDYALWDIIENDNSFNLVARTITNTNGTSALTILGPVTTEEKVQKKNDVKARSYGFKANKGVCENSSNEIKKTTDALIIKDWVSDYDEDDYEVMVLKSDNVQHKPKQANQPKKMVQKPVLNNVKKGTGQREVKPVWNNAMRVNHQNFSNSRRNFFPTAVLTKTGIVPVSAARPINTAAPKSFVNAAKTRPNAFQKSHSLSRRPFYQQTTLKNKILNSVKTAKGNRVTSAVGEQGINAVKSSACWTDSSLELKGYLINNGYADLVKM